MTRRPAQPYREPAVVTEARGVVARRVEPPDEPEVEAERARRDAGLLLARQIGEDGKEERRSRRRFRAFELLLEVIGGFFRSR